MPQNAWGALSIAGTGGSVERRLPDGPDGTTNANEDVWSPLFLVWLRWTQRGLNCHR
jgi:hypothetical protein